MEKRFWDKVNKTDTCWLWAGSNSAGYGQIYYDGKLVGAHRIAYTLLVGTIPKNMVIDHLCKVKLCVNPKHLEVVTQRENTMRGTSEASKNAKKTHCKRGHEFTPNNTYINPHKNNRNCRKCKNIKQNYMRKRGKWL